MSSIRREEYAAMEIRVRQLEAKCKGYERLIASLKTGMNSALQGVSQTTTEGGVILPVEKNENTGNL